MFEKPPLGRLLFPRWQWTSADRAEFNYTSDKKVSSALGTNDFAEFGLFVFHAHK
jgi:hypothetical protein